jgi:ribosomal protein S18 acetylase RimI-like enzyme
MSIEIRVPVESEMEPVGKLAGSLVRMHHAIDPERFLITEPIEEGYARFLTRMVSDPRSVVLIANDSELGIVGYTYGRSEPRDWNRLLDEHSKLHDIVVDPRVRQRGVGRALLTATLEKLRAAGAKRILLDTAHSNLAAQRLFESAGFRPTMIEMIATEKPVNKAESA